MSVEDFVDLNLVICSEWDFIFYNLFMGINVLLGEVFIIDKLVFNIVVYVLVGGGFFEFLGEKDFVLNLGFGLWVIVSDLFVMYIMF